MNHTYKMTIAYDGTLYNGWQVQPNGSSIQAEIQNALQTLLKKPTPIVGSGRTDAGVHALGQVAHFTTSQNLEVKKILFSLNSLLPHDIRIKELISAPPGFHARYSAIKKIYHYRMHLHSHQDPFNRLYSTHIRHPIDTHLLQKAIPFFIGTHDFTSFSNEPNRGSALHKPIKTLYSLKCIQEGDQIILIFEGDGFLYKMVRNIVGTLLMVASNKFLSEEIPGIFEAKDRRKAGPAAPPQGLFLHSVYYRE